MRDAFSPREDFAGSFQPGTWAGEGDRLDADDRLWKQYIVLVELYKYYLEVAWKAAVWYYATTGAVLAFYLDRLDAEDMRISPLLLLFVAVMSFGFTYLAWRGARNLSSIPALLEHIAVTLRIPGRPHVEFAVIFLLMNSAMFMLVGLACAALGIPTLFL
jgi:hypothetical protein